MANPYSIPQAYIDQYTSNLHYQAEQKASHFRSAATVEEVAGKKSYHERMSGTEAKKRTGQYEPKSTNQPTHSRRLMTCDTWDVDYLIDKNEDIKRILIDPQSAYPRMAAEAQNRRIDETFVAAAFADVVEGQEGGTTTTFANDGGQTIAAGGTGLTKAKIDTILQNWLEADVPAEDKRYLACSPQGLTQLMKEEEFINNDYIMQAMLAANTGGVGVIPGYQLNVIVSTKLSVTSLVRDCIAFTEQSMKIGFVYDVNVRTGPRYDLEGDPLGISSSMSVGALRMEGARVQKVQIAEVA